MSLTSSWHIILDDFLIGGGFNGLLEQLYLAIDAPKLPGLINQALRGLLLPSYHHD